MLSIQPHAAVLEMGQKERPVQARKQQQGSVRYVSYLCGLNLRDTKEITESRKY
jgi:hypothetical protein